MKHQSRDETSNENKEDIFSNNYTSDAIKQVRE